MRENPELTVRDDEQLKTGADIIRSEEIQNTLRTVLGLQSVIVRGFVYKELSSVCAFYTDPVDISWVEAQAALEKVLPSSMIPTNFIRLPSFPMLPTGKVDIAALLPPEGSWEQFSEENNSELSLLGQGRVAHVYRLCADKVVKVFKEQYSLILIMSECLNGQIMHKLGVFSPRIYGIVRMGSRYGFIQESLEGYQTFEKAFEEHFDCREELIRLYVRGIRQMHSVSAPEGTLLKLKQYFPVVEEQAEQLFGKEAADSIRKVLGHIPHRDTVLQLDCHIGNCFAKGDQAVFFDFVFAGLGHPILDLSAMYAHLVFWPSVDHRGKLSPEQCRILFDLFLREYLGTQDRTLLSDAERQLRCVQLIFPVLGYIISSGFHSEDVAKIALEMLKEDADWFVEQDLIS